MFFLCGATVGADMTITVLISIPRQYLSVYASNEQGGARLCAAYPIASALLGVGQVRGSQQTPAGLHVVRAKIGAGLPINTVLVRRRPTGEIYSPALQRQYPKRDWILTRIVWLSGLEPGVNRWGAVDTMRRFIYIHGTPDSIPMGVPSSHGCIRMHNPALLELFELLPVGAKVYIAE